MELKEDDENQEDDRGVVVMLCLSMVVLFPWMDYGIVVGNWKL